MWTLRRSSSRQFRPLLPTRRRALRGCRKAWPLTRAPHLLARRSCECSLGQRSKARTRRLPASIRRSPFRRKDCERRLRLAGCLQRRPLPFLTMGSLRPAVAGRLQCRNPCGRVPPRPERVVQPLTDQARLRPRREAAAVRRRKCHRGIPSLARWRRHLPALPRSYLRHQQQMFWVVERRPRLARGEAAPWHPARHRRTLKNGSPLRNRAAKLSSRKQPLCTSFRNVRHVTVLIMRVWIMHTCDVCTYSVATGTECKKGERDRHRATVPISHLYLEVPSAVGAPSALLDVWMMYGACPCHVPWVVWCLFVNLRAREC